MLERPPLGVSLHRNVKHHDKTARQQESAGKESIVKDKREQKITFEWDSEQVIFLNDILTHCHKLFGGNSLEWDETCISMLRETEVKIEENNIRKTNIV